ncbi:MAG: dimethyl sulfoxide reductase anchor subunit family protein [Gemmobacter sp.]
MHPAPSVIVFTVLSGMGFGFLALLGLGVVGWAGLWAWALGYGLAIVGLVASAFHLGNPQRALLAFTQWRTSWLSREAVLSVAALSGLAPMALSDWLDLGFPRVVGVLGAVLAVAAVIATGMIYAQIRAVPRWHHGVTPVLFLGFAVTGGLILSGHARVAALACLGLVLLLRMAWRIGDGQFARAGQTLGTATGLAGKVDVFEWPHTGDNYLLREMIHVVGRRHAERLRLIAVVLAGLVPALLLLALPGAVGAGLATLAHLLGALAARWLFFAEAEHVVGLYYGRR